MNVRIRMGNGTIQGAATVVARRQWRRHAMNRIRAEAR